jgi:hypothetical protein
MKAKLIKTGSDYLLRDMGGDVLAITKGTTEGRKLSKQNCDDIFGVIDVEKLAEDFAKYHSIYPTAQDDTEYGFKNGFNKAMELNKDKVFTLEDMRNAMDWIMTQYFEFHEQPTIGRREQYLESLQQPTEIEVEIEMEDVIQLKKRAGGITNMGLPKLDSEGCLILKKI